MTPGSGGSGETCARISGIFVGRHRRGVDLLTYFAHDGRGSSWGAIMLGRIGFLFLLGVSLGACLPENSNRSSKADGDPGGVGGADAAQTEDGGGAGGEVPGQGGTAGGVPGQGGAGGEGPGQGGTVRQYSCDISTSCSMAGQT